MKHIVILLIALILSAILIGQVPQSFNYQAVVRTDDGSPVSNESVSFRISIQEGGAGGSSIYIEEFSAVTNDFGHVNLPIGYGTIVSGDFSLIDWGNSSFFLNIELDPDGGNNFQQMGVSQLLSVPYSLFSEKAKDDGDWTVSGNIMYTSMTGSIGIGTSTPDASSVLDLSSDTMGLLIPRVELNDANTAAPIVNPAEGLLIFNSTGTEATGLWYWDDSSWIHIGTGGGTLENAYNHGGNGAGRIINANYGAFQVNLNSTTGGTEGISAISSAGTSGTPTSAVSAENSGYGSGLYAFSDNAANPYNAIEGSSNSVNQYTSGVAGYYDGYGQGVGVYGAVYDAASQGIAGVMGVNNRTNGGWGVEGQGFNGVVGQSNYGTGFGVYGSNSNAIGANNGVGTLGDGFYGVWGQTGGSVTNGTAGVFGMNARIDGGWGVEGQGFNGVVGMTVEGQGYGVYGENSSTGTTYNNIGTAGLGWVGVFGETNDFSTGFGVYANGDLGSSGTKAFIIDHPLDPENNFLRHTCIESPEVLNMYRGTVQLNSKGKATVHLPDYFETININYSYHLTPIGSAAPNLYIEREIENNSFTMAGGVANMKVSWTVYSERNDPYMKKYPDKRKAVVEKRGANKGKYLMPELYDQPKEKRISKHLKIEDKALLKPLQLTRGNQSYRLNKD